MNFPPDSETSSITGHSQPCELFSEQPVESMDFQAAVPTLTLSLNGVEFCLVPDDNDVSSVKFERDSERVLLKLSSFTGTLRVTPSHNSELLQTQAGKSLAQITPRASNTTPHVQNKRERVEKAESPTVAKRSRSDDDVALSNHLTPLSPNQQVEDPVIQETEQDTIVGTQTTLLGQPDLSQTQLSMTQPTDEELNERTSQENLPAESQQPSRVQQLIEGDNQSLTCSPVSTTKVGADDDQAASIKSHHSIILDDAKSDDVNRAAAPARVSLGASPIKTPKQEPPSPRWGHTMTDIGSNRILVYGGQSFDKGLPKTMNDLHIFDTTKQLWYQPFNCEGMPRQWHTATYLPERQLLISFGGEAAHPKTGKCKTTDQVMVLDTEIMLWYPPTVSGTIPSGRSGHTATLLKSTNELVVFGGVHGTKWLNTVSVLDTMRWKWTTPKNIKGSAPQPRSYHTATAVGTDVVIFGGNDAARSFDTLHVLETATWTWRNIQAVAGPSPRTGHAAVLLADGVTICVYGGWDPNADDDNGQDDLVFDDTYLLDTTKWVWSKGPPAVHVPSLGDDADEGSKRVGHAAVWSPDGSKILVFGGRVPGDRFAGDFRSISVK